MKIVFVLPQQKAATRFELMLAELGRRGHEVRLSFRLHSRAYADEAIDRVRAAHPTITRGLAPAREEPWGPLAKALRRGVDYLRYLSPHYAGAPKLRARGARWAPAVVVRLAAWPMMRSARGIRLLDRVLRWLESAIPDDPAILGFLRAEAPELVLVSPLVDTPWQADYVRGARSLGIRCALLVASWDNLTNKGLIRDAPDRVYLWNQDQRREAVELHGVPAERVVATGAHSFDHWFGWEPSTTPEEFRRRLGFEADPDHPIVLYVCSSNFIAPDEPEFVERWLNALRAHADERLRNASVLIRPHPRTGEDWKDTHLADLPEVAVWPRQGTFNLDAADKSDYFDSLHHSAVVVGLNTSALIESAIVGRPVFTVLDPRYAETQEGTLHFHYLLRENGGPLTVANDFGEHFHHLAAALSTGGRDGEGEREFVRRFVRPRGLDQPAVPVLVDAIEQQVAAPAPAAAPRALRRTAGGLALRPLAAAVSWRERHPARPAARRRGCVRRARQIAKRGRRRFRRAGRRLAALRPGR